MAVFHIKVNVSRTLAPNHTGLGAVLITVMTGTTYASASSAITASTVIHYQHVGQMGENELWFVTGPSTVYAAVSVAHPFFTYIYSIQGISVNTLATYTLTLGPKSGLNPIKCVPKKYLYAMQTSTLNPTNLKAMMENSDYQTSVTDRHYVTSKYCNDTYSRVRCYYGDYAEYYNDKLCTGLNIGWHGTIDKTGAIYDYDPSTPPESYYPPYRAVFNDDVIVISNSTNRTLRIYLILWVKATENGAEQTVGSVTAEVGPGSNSYSISYVSTDWPDIYQVGYRMSYLRDTDNNPTTQSYRLTMDTNIGTLSSSYYSGDHSASLHGYPLSSARIAVNDISLEFY